jgi:anti-anti-sigma factor
MAAIYPQQRRKTMPIRHEVLRVYETDPAVVIGFGDVAVLDPGQIAECREEIEELLTLHEGKALAIDLMDVQYIPSVVLGMLASLTRMGTEVHLYNVSATVRDVLGITNLSQLFRIHEHLF